MPTACSKVRSTPDRLRFRGANGTVAVDPWRRATEKQRTQENAQNQTKRQDVQSSMFARCSAKLSRVANYPVGARNTCGHCETTSPRPCGVKRELVDRVAKAIGSTALLSAKRLDGRPSRPSRRSALLVVFELLNVAGGPERH